jgi:formylglycine-generating enzyme required for sulfatase activity
MGLDRIAATGKATADLRPPLVLRWSGREVRALRQARRMSVRDFAKHLGVTPRMVSKWEAGGDEIQPRPVNQEALDTSLTRSSPEAQALFGSLLAEAPIAKATRSRAADPQSHAVQDDPMTMRHPRDGKTMVLVSAGTFLSGRDNSPAEIDDLYIDLFPVTNAEYRRFVTATGHRAPLHWIGDRCPGALLDHPVVFVTWNDAIAYATWAGKTLPTALEWEKAARGDEGGIYPWGSQPTPAKCNVRESRIGFTTPIDRYHSGASPYGIYDLCGNTWEWCDDETEPGRHQLKGSAFTSPFTRAIPSMFNDASADMLDDDTGFRSVCVDASSSGPDRQSPITDDHQKGPTSLPFR